MAVPVWQPRDSTPETPLRFSITTLGCKVNRFESEHLAEQLRRQNYRPAAAGEGADLHIINTCTVTAEAARQARQAVRRAVRESPRAKVVVTGCYAQMEAAAVAEIAGVDLVVGNAQKLAIPQYLQTLSKSQTEALPPVLGSDLDPEITEINLPEGLISGFEGRARAFVQIQQGCDQGCTFCIIHKARGANRSFAAAAIVRQVARLVCNGFGEIVLCGVDIGAYGDDFGKNTPSDSRTGNALVQLLRRLLRIDGDFRLRLSSIDPVHVSDELVDLLAHQPRLCPQLHLSLQSANTLILKRMKRRASRELVYARVAALREACPDLVLSADILVGFPTETEVQFGETLSAVAELEIAYPHVFAYSPRHGTPAARIPKQVPVAERKARAAAVRARGREVWRRVAAQRVGSVQRVLVENTTQQEHSPIPQLLGRAGDYLPIKFAAPDTELAVGDWARLRVTGVADECLVGDFVV